jgi:hypothetical protein
VAISKKNSEIGGYTSIYMPAYLVFSLQPELRCINGYNLSAIASPHGQG